jgi:hypothetical protein
MGSSDDCSTEDGGGHGKVTDKLFVIRTFSSDVEARLAESVLEANGIESSLIGDNAAGMLPYLNAMHPIRLVVKESDIDTALGLLDSAVSEDQATD